MSIDIRDTLSLMQAMERITPAASFLVDTFFPVQPPVATSKTIAVEYRKRGRKLAPFVTKGAKGVNMTREGSKVAYYEAPMMAPRRTVSADHIEQRAFGESIMSTMTPAERATQLQAADLVDLQNMCMNTKNKMAADILTTGKCEIRGYADDGTTELIDTIEYDFDQIVTPSVKWDQAGASIMADMQGASQQIQENAGIVPTVGVVGKNVLNYMLNNDEIMKYLLVPSVDNLKVMTLQPQYLAPQVRFVGRITALNLDLYEYAETYIDENGKMQYFIGADQVVMGVPGRGKQLHGAVTLLDQDLKFNTYASQYVPYYSGSNGAQELDLTMYSRCILAPEFVDDWAVINTK